MGRGRPGKGLGHVDGLEGPEASKARMKLILETLHGTRSVKDAAEALSISESRFAALRQEALQDWLDALAPGTPGRPPKDKTPEAGEVERLEHQVRELMLDLKIAQTRTELALTMPHVLKDTSDAEPSRKREAKKGGTKKKRSSGKPPWFGDSTKGT